MPVAAQKALDLQLPLNVLRDRKGSLTIPELAAALRKKGVSEGDARDLIWRLLSLGELELAPDMTVRVFRSNGLRGAR